MAVNANKKWTLYGTSVLCAMASSGEKHKQIASRLGRTTNAVDMKLKKLRKGAKAMLKASHSSATLGRLLGLTLITR